MKKYILLILLLLLSCLSFKTYCAFVVNVERNGTITTNELSTSFLDNSDLLLKVQNLDSSITSIDKNNDLNRYNNVPSVTFTDDNIVSTVNSSVPIYLWVDNGVLYYYTIATTIDLNNN